MGLKRATSTRFLHCSQNFYTQLQFCQIRRDRYARQPVRFAEGSPSRAISSSLSRQLTIDRAKYYLPDIASGLMMRIVLSVIVGMTPNSPS
jgi:hypothetical protein